MKKITALLGIWGVVSLVSGCSTDTSSDVNSDDISTVASSSSDVQLDSSDKKSSAAKPSAKSSSSAGKTVRDTTIVRDTVRVSSEKGEYKDPYFSSGIFCWSAECESSWNSSSSKNSSSSVGTIEINMSSSTPVPPLISGSQMIDQRDQKSYAIKTIAGKLWMAKNLNYATDTGSYCGKPGDKDMCATYGRYYTYETAKKVCPDGWRLPTLDEVQAADAAVAEEWWTLGGRVKFDDDGVATEYGLDDQQGYWWISGGTSWRVQPDTDEHVEQSTSAANGRAYSVRCVQD